MKEYQRQFIDFAIQNKVLKFGEFKLKSGRISPYFFNAGMFNDGNAFYQLGHYYSTVIQDQFYSAYDALFGPAYKGISLATAASIGLLLKYNQNTPVSFNRKEVKDHGEGGTLIGSSLFNKRALLIDDVITAGTTIRESVKLINSASGKLIGIIIALDRQEKGHHSQLSATQEVEKEFNLRVSSIITLEHLIEYLKTTSLPEANQYSKKILEYRDYYGV
jgi:orotate phosphoribosyltransferase